MEGLSKAPPMAEPGRRGVLEVLNRAGQVQQRIPVDDGEWRVGRAWDNDIVVADPYVCPHHMRLAVDGRGVTLRDLDSVNGSWIRGGRQRVERAVLGAGDAVHFGHSQLRFHPATESVAPALRDPLARGALRTLGRLPLQLAALLLALLALALETAVEESRVLGVGIVLNQLVYPVLGLALWAALWSTLNRLVSQRANYLSHLAIGALGVTGLYLAEQGVQLLCFAFGWLESHRALSLLAQMAVAGLVLFGHIHYISHGRLRLQAVACGLLAALLVGSPTLGDWLRRDDFSSLPRLDPLLEPPAVRRVEGAGVDAFLQRAERLKERVDQRARSG